VAAVHRAVLLARSLAGPRETGTSDRAYEVTLSRKEAKSRTSITGLRSKTTKATTHVDRLRAANADLKKKLAEALEQQTATSEVLRVISSSPGDLQPVFQAMLENATRICEAKFGVMWLSEGGGFQSVAVHGPAAHVELRRRQPVIHPGPELPLGRLAHTRQIVHIADIRTERAYVEGENLRSACGCWRRPHPSSRSNAQRE